MRVVVVVICVLSRVGWRRDKRRFTGERTRGLLPTVTPRLCREDKAKHRRISHPSSRNPRLRVYAIHYAPNGQLQLHLHPKRYPK